MTSRLFKPLFESLLKGTGVRLGGDRPWDIRVHRDRLYRRALRGSLGIGESYLDGDWDCDALDEMFRRVLSSNAQQRPLIRAAGALKGLQSRLTNLQTRRRSRAVAEEHYDIDHRMYALFLGPWNQYTCCFFDSTSDLERAEVAKLEMLCDKLELKPGERLLDIGCGWGGFAKYAAATRGCEVTGISLSDEQVRFAAQFAMGLPVTIRRMDYRDLPDSGLPPFDKISIVGMIEHVGYKNYAGIMGVVHQMLKPDGLFLLHTIGNCEETRVVDRWIEKYIFRNSMAPAMGQLADAAEGRFVIEDWENYGHHYVPTLQAWYDRFNANWDRIRALPTSKPFDERFRRMWNYYLMSSKAAFDVELLHLWQLVMTRRNSGRGVYRRVLQRSAGRPQPTSRETAEPQALDAPSRRIRAAGPGRG
jgi:cyclopropane-fatty-acyl-phospholipid synthase